MKYIQSRIKAPSSDIAAVKIRDKHNEYEGSLHIKRVNTAKDTYEYNLELKEE